MLVACSAQFGVKFTAGFGKVLFAPDAAAAAPGIEELNGSLQWVEGELSKSEGPFFMGPDFTLVRHTGTLQAQTSLAQQHLDLAQALAAFDPSRRFARHSSQTSSSGLGGIRAVV